MPQSARSAAIRPATASVGATSSTAPSARLPGVELPLPPLEPGDVAALLVDASSRPGSDADSAAQLLAVADVVREERQPAEAAVGQRSTHSGASCPGKLGSRQAAASRSSAVVSVSPSPRRR